MATASPTAGANYKPEQVEGATAVKPLRPLNRP